MVIIDLEDLIGKTFKLPLKDGKQDTATIVETIHEHEDNVKKNPTHTKFKISHSKDKYEEILSYNELMDHLNKQEGGPLEWELKRIVAHQGPLPKEYPSYQGSKYNVKV